jgi:hypothetical protein
MFGRTFTSQSSPHAGYGRQVSEYPDVVAAAVNNTFGLVGVRERTASYLLKESQIVSAHNWTRSSRQSSDSYPEAESNARRPTAKGYQEFNIGDDSCSGNHAWG